eukprot:TRINITY_DN1384_c0_g1_i1.p1 TRINITY_DN1384_c0_g1~~TRINITY_DN1384_c0_g1_i1.p1  ORF type:complete len:247 (-),score=119.05 TRINITY_DN1384_c0_g1_i1:82-822(-)
MSSTPTSTTQSKKFLIVVAHAELKSFNHALVQRTKLALENAGHQVQISDLYSMNWDPVSSRKNFKTVKNENFYKQQIEELHASENNGFVDEIETEISKLEWCDALIFQFPLWWFGLPAILKGWVDRVFVMGRVYGRGKWYDNGVFKNKRAICCLTTGGPAPMYSANGLNGDINQILFPINNGILRFVGFDVVQPFIAFSAAHISDEQRIEYLNQWERRVLNFFNEPLINYPLLSDYDSNFVLKQQQ